MLLHTYVLNMWRTLLLLLKQNFPEQNAEDLLNHLEHNQWLKVESERD